MAHLPTIDPAKSPTASGPKAPPAVSPDLVIKYKKGDVQQRLVLRVQDTGGQPVFLSILELLMAPDATVHLVVFNLAELRESFEGCIESVADQLHAIQASSAGAPLILCGTHKDSVVRDEGVGLRRRGRRRRRRRKVYSEQTQ